MGFVTIIGEVTKRLKFTYLQVFGLDCQALV